MQVTLKNSFTIDQPIERVWKFLSDPYKVAPCLPGAEILEAVDEKTYKGAIKMKLGPFTSQFKGEVVIEHLDEAAHEIRMVGKGKDVKGTGSASMTISGKLKALPDGGTEMESQSDLIISGKLAQFGSRMIEDVSKSMFRKFTEAFSARLAAEAAGEAPPETEPGDNAVSVTEVAGAVVRGAMGRLFGKGEKE
ncbi:MAG: SRPBCC family protein [SAR324 cluster bacterium]|nr:SRPBCC family protein [SAR324 cluster bacterium]